MTPGRMTPGRTSPSEQVGAAVGSFAVLMVAGALTGVRSSMGAANVALVLVTIVVLAGMTGLVAGATTAIVAAVSFNFFHTQPYRSLRISDGRDIATVMLLLGIGLLVGGVAEWRHRTSRASSRHLRGEHALEDVTELLASGATTEAMTAAISARLVRDLRLGDCRYESRPTTDLPVVGRTGGLPTEHLRLGDGGVQLPSAGAAVAVTSSGVLHGWLVLTPPATAASASTREQRRIAVALADLLAVAIDRDRTTSRS